METISISELENLKENNKIIIMDIREKSAFIKFHIPKAIHMDYASIMRGEYCLPIEYVYLLYCERGGLSLLAARKLEEDGFHVKSIIGGMRSYNNYKNHQQKR